MHINYSDEEGRLTAEMWSLIKSATDSAMEFELGERLSAHGFSSSDINAEISVTIASDDEIRELNREYREKDSVTDVLSFPQFEDIDEIEEAILAAEDGLVLLGDVVICHDRAVRQAKEYGTGVTRELVYLFVHSIMHLMGYDHEDEDDKKLMRAHEEAVLERIGLGR